MSPSPRRGGKGGVMRAPIPAKIHCPKKLIPLPYPRRILSPSPATESGADEASGGRRMSGRRQCMGAVWSFAGLGVGEAGVAWLQRGDTDSCALNPAYLAWTRPKSRRWGEAGSFSCGLPASRCCFAPAVPHGFRPIPAGARAVRRFRPSSSPLVRGARLGSEFIQPRSPLLPLWEKEEASNRAISLRPLAPQGRGPG
jgi:hypothetical protein